MEVRYSTDDDLERCEEIELTSEFDMWDPINEDCTSASSLLISNEVNSELKDDFDSKIPYACISSLRRESTSDVNAYDLSKLWNIYIKDAEMTLNSTTNNSIRLNEGRLTRRYKTEAHQRQYKQLGGYLSQFYSDTFFSGVESARGNTCVQLFTNKGGFVRTYQIADNSQSYSTLQRFLHEVGVPSTLMTECT